MTTTATEHGTREWADGQLTGRCRDRRKVANNTYLERLGDDIGLLYHATHIIVWRPNGDIVLDSGGWRTMTTKDRMSAWLPGRSWVRQEKGIWYVLWHGNEHRYADEMVLHPDGSATGALDENEAAKRDRTNETKRKHIRRFVNSITAEKVVHAFENSDGDCLLCRAGDTGHLLEHVTAGYFHAHLVYNAVKEQGYANPDSIMQRIYYAAKQRDEVSDFLTDNLGKFLRKHILEEVATR